VTLPGTSETNGADSVEQDVARANVYAIISRLFYDAPDEPLLVAIAQDSGEDPPPQSDLGIAWSRLRSACKNAIPFTLKQEFDNLFIGVGKSEITPYTSHYVKQGGATRHLVRLRELLMEWNLQRRDAATEAEDHVSGISDVMRHLISDDRGHAQQQLFFKEFVYPGMVPLCDAIERSPNAEFYRCVAQFVRVFLVVENEALELADD